MVQDIIVEILCDYLAVFNGYLAKIGLVLIFGLVFESVILHDMIIKFRAYVKIYFFTLYLEKLKLMNPLKEEIFSLFFIDKIVLIVEILENLDYHGQLFIIKAIDDYKAERAIINVFYLFSVKNRTINAISKFFTFNRQKNQFAIIFLVLNSIKLLNRIIYPLLNVVEYIVKKVTFDIFRFCHFLLTFIRSFL